MDWALSKENKIPLYLQLKDLIKYSISTGALQHSQQLPTVHGLAKRLSVNFETVRKAYKDLEQEGLVSTGRGVGTFVTGHAVSALRQQPTPQPVLSGSDALKQAVQQLLREGRKKAEIELLVAGFIKEYSTGMDGNVVLFAECNTRQANEISKTLREYLNVDVQPILLSELPSVLDRSNAVKELSIVTTGFHMKEVRQIVGSRPVRVDFVVASMSPGTRRQIDAYPKTARFGFVCRDLESRNFYPEVLRAELAIKSPISVCLLNDKAELTALLKTVDVLLVTPSVYDAVRKMASSRLPLFNIQDRVDPMSLKALRDSLSIARQN